jgi:Protein of unknown function (DUF4087)
MNFKTAIVLNVGFLALSAAPAFALEKRCGWLANPTPANWFLRDRDTTWVIGLQGGFQAQGIDKIPDLSRTQYVRTNGSYGYACACLDVMADKKRGRITQISQVKQLPLKQCRDDRSLPKMTP